MKKLIPTVLIIVACGILALAYMGSKSNIQVGFSNSGNTDNSGLIGASIEDAQLMQQYGMHSNDLVYVSKHNFFHHPSCSSIPSDSRRTTLSDALDKNVRACPMCTKRAAYKQTANPPK